VVADVPWSARSYRRLDAHANGRHGHVNSAIERSGVVMSATTVTVGNADRSSTGPLRRAVRESWRYNGAMSPQRARTRAVGAKPDHRRVAR
jgi:hypothetical protein